MRRERSRSACVVNGRLRHTGEGRGEGSEWLEAGLRGLATSGPGRGSSPGHQRAIAAQIRDEDSHRVDDSAHRIPTPGDGKTAVNHMWASTTSGCTPRPLVVHAHEIGVRSGKFRSVQTAWKKSFQEIVCGGWPPTCSKPRRGSGWGQEAKICQRSSLSSGHSAPSTILDRGASMPDCDYRPQV